ncbi:palmitoyltransferase ZDHHC16-like [Montipora capricornis]|uniref:palmitoyltransferase ZDHHC16-like n=1 Tax=Montipora foliosa TaxID=591990 RepID=UPI0035F16BA8
MKSCVERLKVVLFALRSLTFNSGTSQAVVLDTIFEPVFSVVDHLARIIGPAFVLLVISLTTSVVVIYYAFLLPVILEYSIPWVIFHLVTAHWLLMNIVFHYFKAVFTSPGDVPKDSNSEDVQNGKFQICRKCIKVKPPRSHHCSVCKRCILKMDHHCPWINNCVGHFNHKYFISFCTFMCLGTLYVTISSRNLFIRHFTYDWNDTFNRSSDIVKMQNSSALANKLKLDIYLPSKEDSGSQSERRCILFVFMLCSAVTISLGILTAWHFRLISSGETSIEWHINKEDAKKLRKQGLVFRNPYDYGILSNWRMLLGLVDGRSWLHLLLPSSHPPFGDGITWAPLPEVLKDDAKGKLHFV